MALALVAATVAGYVATLPLRVGLLAVAGWLLASFGDLAPIGWIQVLVGEVALLAGLAAASVWAAGPVVTRSGGHPPATSRRDDEGSVVALLVAGSLLGVGLTVPDVEQIAVTAPTAAVVAALAATLSGRGGVVTTARAVPGAVVLVAWIAAAGGFGRSGAVVGAIGCLGLLVLEPLARRVTGGLRSDGWPRWREATWRIGMHAAVVLVASRVAGLRSDPWQAAAIVAVTWGGALVVSARSPRRQPP